MPPPELFEPLDEDVMSRTAPDHTPATAAAGNPWDGTDSALPDLMAHDATKSFSLAPQLQPKAQVLNLTSTDADADAAADAALALSEPPLHPTWMTLRCMFIRLWEKLMQLLDQPPPAKRR
ncbi:MAG: hypothetical protein ACYST0_00530 [Planctomycetota bacterium]|jgi:hypothetical protein